jgi:hypothetical protein
MGKEPQFSVQVCSDAPHLRIPIAATLEVLLRNAVVRAVGRQNLERFELQQQHATLTIVEIWTAIRQRVPH